MVGPIKKVYYACMVKTNFSVVRFSGDEARSDNVYKGVRHLTAKDIADTIIFVVEAPDHINIQSLYIMPIDQRSSYVVHREKN